MSYDLFAALKASNDAEIEAVQNGRLNELLINNVYTRLKLLSGDIFSKDKIKAAHKKIVHERKLYDPLIASELERMGVLYIKKPQIDINSFPRFSCYIQFTFKLAKPYLSKDDDAFYTCENPIKKDKVFKVPMVAASTWKGNMRWTARQNLGLNSAQSDSPVIIRLFGNEKGKDSRLKRGRLNFFPTFFDRIGLEVINPHDRKTKAGTLPIYIETVPTGAAGIFSLLYVPFDLMGRPEDHVRRGVVKDLEIIHSGIKGMMLTYGFSAKKNSGFGIIKDELMAVSCEMNGINVQDSQNMRKAKTKLRSKPVSLINLKTGIEEKEREAVAENCMTFEDLEQKIELIMSELTKSETARRP